jgi:LacI family transcriptional regulator
LKKVTSKDVAKLAGVSQSAVSLILNNKKNVSFSQETIEKVLFAARELNYHPIGNAKKNSDGQKKLIALFTPTLVNPFYPLLTQIIERSAIENGYNIILFNTFRSAEIEQSYLNMLAESSLVDGIIYEFSPTFPESLENISALLPVVVVAEKNDTLNVDTVGLNSRKAGMLIAEHLVKLGHKNIAFISTPIDKATLSRSQRLDGLISKLKEYNLDDNLLIKIADHEQEYPGSIYEIEVGYTLTLEVLEDPNITAIIGVNDITACGILKALQTRGHKIPQQFSVCGFDNIFISAITNPTLTTIDHCINLRGKTAVDILLEKIQNTSSLNNHERTNIYKIEYEPQLVIGDSTGPCKSK